MRRWGRTRRRLNIATRVQRVFLLGTTELGLGAWVGALKFPEPSDSCRTQAVHLCPVHVMALAVIASRDPQVTVRRRNRRSQPASPSVLAEVARDLLGLCPPTQLVVVPVLQNLVAVEGILNSFQRLLQTFQARFERLQPMLRIDVWRPRA
jgi:hypothetical protein